MDLVELLNKAVELKASDVHITVNLSPIARINGKFQKFASVWQGALRAAWYLPL